VRAAQARAPTTLSTYYGPWSRFKAWCLEHGVSYLPAKLLTVALYLTKLMRTASSPNPILSCSGAIFLRHHLAGLPSPTYVSSFGHYGLNDFATDQGRRSEPEETAPSFSHPPAVRSLAFCPRIYAFRLDAHDRHLHVLRRLPSIFKPDGCPLGGDHVFPTHMECS
jgi:hypothetical protein